LAPSWPTTQMHRIRPRGSRCDRQSLFQNFGSLYCFLQAVVDAVGSELKNHLDNQLRCMLDATMGAPHVVVPPGPPPPAPPAADGAKKMYCDGIYLLLVALKARGFHFMDFRVCVELARDQRPAIVSPYYGTQLNSTKGFRAIDIIREDKRFQIEPNVSQPRISLAPA